MSWAERISQEQLLRLKPHEVPYIAPPENPNRVVILEEPAEVYIDSTGVDLLMRRFVSLPHIAEGIAKARRMFVNLNGGNWIGTNLQKYIDTSHLEIIPVEYHRSENGFGCNVVQPIPHELLEEDGIIVDDISDSGGCAYRMRMDAPNPLKFPILTVLDKDVDGKIRVPGTFSAFRVDKFGWYGGCGMEMVEIKKDDEMKEARAKRAVGEIIRSLGYLIVKPTTSPANPYRPSFINPFRVAD